MKNKKLIRFVESFVLLPVMTISLPLGNLPNGSVNVVLTPTTALSQKQNIEASGLLAYNQADEQEAKLLKLKADAVDAYFREHNMPLEGTGKTMVQEAEENGLDWRLLAAIAVRESTGGIHACKSVTFNSFGWGSCRIGFKSNEQAIETIAKHLGGNMKSTADHYDNKTTEQILRTYNPPKIVKRYAEQVMAIMDDIGQTDMALTLPTKETETTNT